MLQKEERKYASVENAGKTTLIRTSEKFIKGIWLREG
jgi:hypothetical protein